MSEKHRVNGMKIGAYVQNSFEILWNENKIHLSELMKLQELQYCKINFNLLHPMLSKSRDPKARYYAKEIIPGFYLTNDWYERHWDQYLKWERKKQQYFRLLDKTSNNLTMSIISGIEKNAKN
jgi:hypothetical protein